jgi:hypothetical protein
MDMALTFNLPVLDACRWRLPRAALVGRHFGVANAAGEQGSYDPELRV